MTAEGTASSPCRWRLHLLGRRAARARLSKHHPPGSSTKRSRLSATCQPVKAGRRGPLRVRVSNERGRLRPHAEMVARFAVALDVTADELLGLERKKAVSVHARQGRRFLRRLEQLAQLPKRDQDALLRTIDAFLSARGSGRVAA